jgi:hypothetical protein
MMSLNRKAYPPIELQVALTGSLLLQARIHWALGERHAWQIPVNLQQVQLFELQ